MTNKIDASELKKIVQQLGDAVFVGGERFENWVVPRVNALLQALDELEALRAELKNWREIKTLFDQTSDDNAYLRHQVTALDYELEALKAELAEKSWRVIGPNFDNLPKLGQRVILFSDGIVRRWAYTADQYDESDRAGVYFWDCDDDQEYCPPIKPGDAWMPWPTEGPKLLEVNNEYSH